MSKILCLIKSSIALKLLRICLAHTFSFWLRSFSPRSFIHQQPSTGLNRMLTIIKGLQTIKHYKSVNVCRLHYPSNCFLFNYVSSQPLTQQFIALTSIEKGMKCDIKASTFRFVCIIFPRDLSSTNNHLYQIMN